MDGELTDTSTRSILASVLSELRALRNTQTQCGAPASVIQDHTEILITLQSDMGHIVDTVQDGFKAFNATLDKGNDKFANILERLSATEREQNITRLGIQSPSCPADDDTAEFAVKKGKVTLDTTKIDWKMIGGWLATAGTFTLAALAYLKGGK